MQVATDGELANVTCQFSRKTGARCRAAATERRHHVSVWSKLSPNLQCRYPCIQWRFAGEERLRTGMAGPDAWRLLGAAVCRHVNVDPDVEMAMG